jgi:Flp pilus assembly protein TadG
MTHVRLVHRSRRSLAERRGAALIEFAIIAPIFFLLVLGIFEFGRGMMVQAMLASAAQQGARAGSLTNAQASDVTTAANEYLTPAGISGATIVVTPSPPSSALPGQDVKVTVSIGYAQVSWIPAPKFLKNKTLSSTAIVQREMGQ